MNLSDIRRRNRQHRFLLELFNILVGYCRNDNGAAVVSEIDVHKTGIRIARFGNDSVIVFAYIDYTAVFYVDGSRILNGVFIVEKISVCFCDVIVLCFVLPSVKEKIVDKKLIARLCVEVETEPITHLIFKYRIFPVSACDAIRTGERDVSVTDNGQRKLGRCPP